MAQRRFKIPVIDRNPIEAVRDIAESAFEPVISSAKNDLLKEMGNDILEQTLSWDRMLGTDVAERGGKKASGDMAPGQEISFGGKNRTEKPSREKTPHIEAGWDYAGEILHAERRQNLAQERELNTKIQEIMAELKKLAKSSKELEITFKEVTVGQRPVTPGKYHLNFFEWMLSTIRSARMRIEDASSWAHMFSAKKNKREYWALFKKHGTSFGLSGERIVATQTG